MVFPLLVLLFWIISLSYVFKSALPVPSNESFFKKTVFFNFLPQGWGFFTRDPREDEVILYQIIEDTAIQYTQTNNSRDNWYGFSRRNRLKLIEAGVIVSQIKDSLWMKMKGGDFILDRGIYTDTINSRFKPCNIKGDYFVVKRERIPWAWAKKQEEIIMPYSYVKIYVKTN